VAPVLGCLALLPGVLGCGLDRRPDPSGDPGPPPATVQAGGDPRERLAELDRIGPTAATDGSALAQLAAAIRDPRPEVVNGAAQWLSKAGQAAVPSLLAALSTPSVQTRTAACYALGVLGRDAQDAVPALLRQLAGESDSVANMADWALSQVEPSGAITLLRELRALRYGTGLERADAASRLALLGGGSASAVALLMRSLGDADRVVAESAGNALVRIGARARPALQAALLSRNPTLRARAMLALSRIGPESHF